MMLHACECGSDRLRLNITPGVLWISCMACGAMGDDYQHSPLDDRSGVFGAADLWNKFPHTRHPAEVLHPSSSTGAA